MDPSDRRKRAAQIADELNSCHLLQDDVKHLLTDLTMARMSAIHSHQIRTFSGGRGATIPRPQFSYRA